jgi:myo-inositol-1(or 4)-monophosphatase
MNLTENKKALATAVVASQAAGEVMRANRWLKKKINSSTQHDIKLELDVRCQKLIEGILRKTFPTIPILGEEGVLGDPEAETETRWVVDPIDGTVNFTYGIPHACVSIALEIRSPEDGIFRSVVGAVYDPFTDELWTAVRGQKARLNGRVIHVSDRRKLKEAIVALGFAKEKHTLEKMLPTFHTLIHRIRKVRIMGSAALSLVYVATGRMDAYVEYGLRLWDVAAGGLILECAGGKFFHEAVKGEYTYEIVASNAHLHREFLKAARV